MKRSISIIGSILLAAALCTSAWAHPGKGKGNGNGGGGAGAGSGGDPGESQAGGLPALEDRVEADEALIATLQMQVSTLMGDVTALQTAVTDLQGQNNFALVDETTTTCTLVNSHSSAGAVSATFISNGVCEVTFSKDVAPCSAVATIVGAPPGEISVASATKTNPGDSVLVGTFVPAGTAAAADFNLTVTCP